MILTKENIGAINIEKLVDEKIKTAKVNELLIIVPTNRKARNLKKEIISKVPEQAVSGLNIETLGTISTKLLQQVKPFKQLSEAAATIFIKQSADEVKLNYFSLYKDEIPFGTLDKIKNVISEYKRQSILPDLLRKEADKLESSEKLKAIDIANIYENYRKKCYLLQAFEIGDVYEELNKLSLHEFVSDFRRLYPDANLIVMDGFDEFSNPEIEIIARISNIGNSKMFLSFDYSSGNKLIFAHLDKCYDKLAALGFVKIDNAERENENDFKNIISTNLFKSGKLPAKHNYKNKITKISAFDREKEIDLIAREIKNLIIEQEAIPHKICVAFNLIQNYSSTVKDIFSKNGIPFNLTDRTPLDNSNPVIAVVNYLEIIENDFYFKNIFRALSSGFVESAGIDVSNLYRISSELKIVSGKENWINTLNDAAANLNNIGDEDDDTNKKRASYEKALNDIKIISDLLKPFEEKLTLTNFYKQLQDFIIKTKLPLKLLEIETDQEKNIRAFTDFLETTSEIFDLLNQQYANEKTFSLTFFMEQIRTACNWARFNVKEKSNYGVLVTNLEEIRGLNFDYLFIGGMSDGDFPTRYSPEIFFSGSFKKQSLMHQTEERFRFYQSLCTWNEKLYLSFPSIVGGKEITASTFLKDFENLFNITEKTETDFEDKIYSKEELQIFVGKYGIEASEKIFKDKFELDDESISHALEIEKVRNENPFGQSEHTGNLNKNSISNDILEKKLNALSSNQYSVSQLEIYAKCPFKFFMERVLNIEAIEEPTEDIEAVEMGRLLHSILYEFYSTLRDKGLELIRCDDKTFKTAEKLIFEIAEKQLQTTAFKSPLTFYEKEKIIGLNGNKKESILYKFLETERNCEDDFLPIFFEVSFGRLKENVEDNLLSSPEPIKIDNIKLRGKIDRIEIDEKLKSFNIVDYKLGGAKPSFEDLKSGISLQLPVYLFAASELLNKKLKGKYTPNEMFIYSLKYAIDDFGKKKVNTKGKKGDDIQSAEQLVQNTLEHVKNYIKEISEGKFNLSPHEDRENIVCRYCQFRTVCRIDEVN